MAKKVYRRFVYLDAEEVLNGLAGIEGGEVTERIQTVTKALGGDLGLKFLLFGTNVGIGGKSSKEVREQLTWKQTIHSTTAVLLRRLEDGGMRTVERANQLADLAENVVVKFDAALQPLPHTSEPMRRASWWRRHFGDRDELAAEERVQALGGRSVATGATLASDGQARVGLQLDTRCLVPEYREVFCRRATVVGPVTHVPANGETCVVRSDDGGTRFDVGSPETGAPARDGLSVVVRPLCIYK